MLQDPFLVEANFKCSFVETPTRRFDTIIRDVETE